LKTRRLPETDHANAAVLLPDARRTKLMRLKGGRPPFTYGPTRKHTSCILNAQPPLVAVADTPWSLLEGELKRDCKGNLDGIAANLEVAKLMYDYAREHGYEAEQVNFDGFPLSIGEKLTYWFNAVLIKDGQLILAGTDFRRSGGYTKAGLKFAFSVMHEQIRAQNPTDFGSAKLGMFRFPQEPKEDRRIHLDIWGEGELFSYDEIIQRSLDTYTTWAEVLEERAEEARKTGTDDGGWWKG
jgi:hypothetical protein